MEKKGQAAMEFLMTYGWAILAAVIAIGVLVYFGVFSPSRLVPETCTLSAPLGCSDDSTAGATGGLSVVVENGAGEDITTSSVTVTNCGTLNATTSTTIPAGGKETYTKAACSTSLVKDANFKGTITVTYTKPSSTRTLESTGSISRKVVA